MARAPDAPNVTGGQLDPYVSQSLQQGQQQSSNRLIAAMQEQGATQRAGMQTASAEKQQQMAGQQSMRKQAAEAEQRDKEMANEIVGKREDHKHTEMLQMQNQRFLTKQSELLREGELQDQKHDDTLAEKAHRRLMALTVVNNATRLASAKETAKILYASAENSKSKYAAMAALDDATTTSAAKAEQDQKSHAIQIQLSKSAILDDKGFDITIPMEVRNIITERTQAGPATRYVPETITVQGGRSILGVVQKRVAANGSKVDITALTSSDLHKITEGIAQGKIDPESVRAAIAGLDGGILAADDKIAESSSEKGKKDWVRQKRDMERRKDALMGLVNDTGTKIVGDKTGSMTVGKVVGDAIGIIDGSTVSAYLANRKAFYGNIEKANEALKEDLRKSQDYGAEFPISPNATPEEIEAWGVPNAAKRAVFPRAGSPAPSAPAKRGPTYDLLGQLENAGSTDGTRVVLR